MAKPFALFITKPLMDFPSKWVCNELCRIVLEHGGRWRCQPVSPRRVRRFRRGQKLTAPIPIVNVTPPSPFSPDVTFPLIPFVTDAGQTAGHVGVQQWRGRSTSC